MCTLFAVIFAPFILAFFNEPVTIEAGKAGGMFGFLFAYYDVVFPVQLSVFRQLFNQETKIIEPMFS